MYIGNYNKGERLGNVAGIERFMLARETGLELNASL